MHTCTHTRTYTYVQAHTCTCAHSAHMHTHVRTHVITNHTHAHTHVHIRTHAHMPATHRLALLLQLVQGLPQEGLHGLALRRPLPPLPRDPLLLVLVLLLLQLQLQLLVLHDQVQGQGVIAGRGVPSPRPRPTPAPTPPILRLGPAEAGVCPRPQGSLGHWGRRAGPEGPSCPALRAHATGCRHAVEAWAAGARRPTPTHAASDAIAGSPSPTAGPQATGAPRTSAGGAATGSRGPYPTPGWRLGVPSLLRKSVTGESGAVGVQGGEGVSQGAATQPH